MNAAENYWQCVLLETVFHTIQDRESLKKALRLTFNSNNESFFVV